jgi:hypothetical protein
MLGRGHTIEASRDLPPGVATRCEMEVRLFERELLLPPYEFLKTEKTKDNMLIDAHALNQCLRSKH